MDRNTIIGIVLIFVIIIGFALINQPSKEELEKAKHRIDSIAKVEQARMEEEARKQQEAINNAPVLAQADTVTGLSPDSLKEIAAVQQFGRFSAATEGERRYITLENDLMRIVFSSQGGRIHSVQLKDYKTWDGRPLYLFRGDSTLFDLNFFADNRNISTQDLFFSYLGTDSMLFAEKDSQTVAFRLSPDSSSSIVFEYTLKPGSYKVGFNIITKNLKQVVAENSNYINLKWQVLTPKQEKGADFESMNTTIYFKHHQDEVDHLSETSDDKENIPTRVDWVGFKQQFFSAAIIAEDPFLNGILTSTKVLGDTIHLKQFSADLSIAIDPRKDENKAFTFYFGPNHFQTLKDQGITDLHRLVPLG